MPVINEPLRYKILFETGECTGALKYKIIFEREPDADILFYSVIAS